ncbi:MAG: HD domain-containing protein [Putridiphycobacter sp.]
MQSKIINKLKIVNDPVHGFITIPSELIFDLIEHPFFQRLRRIKQLGMSHLVYPGANHTRFHHAIGALHLMQKAVSELQKKGVEITAEEKEGVFIAILLHDIGHGPFSHTLEHSLLKDIHHEEVSLLFMNRLNEEFSGKLTLAIEIFTDQYPKKFLHQLVSSQLDMDRLDYLQRDSYFTGVSEGVVGSERIIKMLNVAQNELVIVEKGIYSIENFISARRIMYWQVYMHKTVVSSEFMLRSVLKRAKKLYLEGKKLFASPSLKLFLSGEYSIQDFKTNPDLLNQFAQIDDADIISAIKVWQGNDDKILSLLSRHLINRKLFKTVISKTRFNQQNIETIQNGILNKLQIEPNDIGYFFEENTLVNSAYNEQFKQIKIVDKFGKKIDLTTASDNYNISALSSPVEKSFLCYLDIANF